MQGFPYWRKNEKSTISQKFGYSLSHHLEKFSPSVDFPHQIFLLPAATKYQFLCYNPIKISFLAFSCSYCCHTIFILTLYSLYTQVMLTITFQCLQNNVFSFEKCSAGKNHNFRFSSLGRITPYRWTLFVKTVKCPFVPKADFYKKN